MVYSAISVKHLLIELVALLAVGILLLRMLSRPRRRGSTPHCARCEYNLTGLTSDRCPECGTEMIPANIVYGERVRRPWLAVTSLAVAVIVMVLIGRWAWDYDWYRVRPTAWVLDDLQSSGQSVKSRAWREIRRRLQGDSLSEAQHSRLIDICLAEQAAKTVTLTELINYLGPCLLQGRMNEIQRATFFRQVAQFEMTVRPVMVAGDALICSTHSRCRGPASSDLWIRQNSLKCPQLDGKPPRSAGDLWSSIRMSESGGQGATICRPLVIWGNGVHPGEHRLTSTVQLEVYKGRPEEVGEAGRLYKGEIVLEAVFELLATEPEDYIKSIDDPSYRPLLLTAIQPETVKRGSYETPDGHEAFVEVCLRTRSLPTNVAFEVAARTGKREYSCGEVAGAKGTSVTHRLQPSIPSDVTRFDLVLRSSKEAAKNTVDLFEIWVGELVYPGLRVESEDQPASTATATAAP